ncbi:MULTISPECIES: protein kinase family protein [Streptomyces]|uniref:hypothetical protein n=1 Tax=Streptomyces TaxID=1883 RepID=UPI00067D6D42|nr:MULTISPECIES: hypothetical protein [Streptomyces]
MDGYSGRWLAGRYRLLADLTDGATAARDTVSGRIVRLAALSVPDDWSKPAATPHDALQYAAAAVRVLMELPPGHRLEQILGTVVDDADERTLWIITAPLTGSRPLATMGAHGLVAPDYAAAAAHEILAALAIVHAHGWVHGNLTAQSVRIRAGGQVVLTGLAVSVAQEVLCGYPVQPAPLPDRSEPGSPAFRGPSTPEQAACAHRCRMLRVGAVTERWAPEQAAGIWPLAPVGPAADLWALGALLYRLVQGQPPYPEDTVEDLIDAVVHAAPAPAEDCGVLRPVIESLLRRAPEQRPHADEVQGWLRTLRYGTQEPLPAAPVYRLPAVDSSPAAEPDWPPGGSSARRHRGTGRRRRLPALPRLPRPLGGGRLTHRAALVLLVMVLVLAAAVCAVLLTAEADRAAEDASTCPFPAPGRSRTSGSVHRDPCGFRLALGPGWIRQQEAHQRVRFTRGALTVLVVPGRDPARSYGTDPLAYQRRQAELTAFRADPHGSATGVRLITDGPDATIAQGTFRWTGADGRGVIARNEAMLHRGRYHVLTVLGPAGQRDQVLALFDRLADSYRPAGLRAPPSPDDRQ